MSNATDTSTDLVPASKPALSRSAVGKQGITLGTFDELWSFSNAVIRSGLAPSSLKGPDAIVIALQMGFELGLPPMAALQNIAVINGRPALWGDAQLAVCRATGEVEDFDEWFESGGERLPRNPVQYNDDTVAVCMVKRRGYKAQEVGFSVADAKKAMLWGKSGPWTQYPFRMLRNRARSYALRDTFGDALRGLMTAEEVQEIPAVGELSSGSAANLNEQMRKSDQQPSGGATDDTFEGEIIDSTAKPKPSPAPKQKPADAVKPPENPAEPAAPVKEEAAKSADKPAEYPGMPNKPANDSPFGPDDTYTDFVAKVKAFTKDTHDPAAVDEAIKKMPVNGYDVRSARKPHGPDARKKVLDAIHAGKFDFAAAKIVD